MADRRRSADPSVHQLRLFVVLAEELHFGNAARRMFLTQPALSQQIKMLERRLGTRLVERGTHSVELTSAGRELLPAVKSVIESMDRLQRLADEHGRQITGHLVLGSVGGEAAQPYTHKMLTELRRQHPEITVEIRTLGFSSQFNSVARGDVDAAVLLHPIPPALQTLDLSTESRVALLPVNDPLLTDGTPLTLAQLADRTFVDMPPAVSREWWDYWSVNPRPDGASVRYGPVVDDVEALMLAVARGQGIVFLPAAARHLYPRPGIAYVDVADLPASTAALVWAPKNRSRPVVAALREAACTAVAS
jgi:DNA-binding transcriptional LysR family regulator